MDKRYVVICFISVLFISLCSIVDVSKKEYHVERQKVYISNTTCSKDGIFKSSGGSCLPGSNGKANPRCSGCCPDGMTSIPHYADSCFYCSGTSCLYCVHIYGSSNQYREIWAVPSNMVSSIRQRIKEEYPANDIVCDGTVADVSNNCASNNCAPKIKSYCWIKKENGEIVDYRWQGSKPGDGWTIDEDIIDSSDCKVKEEIVDSFCWVKYGNNNDDNVYKESSIEETGWVKLGETGNVECDENPKCYVDLDGNYQWGKLKGREPLWKVMSGVSKKSDCKAEESIIKPCPPEPTPIVKQEKQATTCEETTTISSDDDSVKCGGSSTSGFYTITCNTKFSNAFDFGNDGMNGTSLISLYSGQGFGFKILASYVKECTGTFDVELWNAMYDSAIRNRDKITRGSREWNKQNNIVNELKGYVTAFNEWKGDLNTVPTVEATINTSPAINIKNFTHKVVETGNVSSNKVITSTVTLRDDSKVNNFTYSNAKNPRKIEYYPPVTEFDAISGKVATSTTTNKVSGGNKIYTDLSVKPGNYSISLKVNDVTSKKEVSNSKCSINVLGQKDMIYRIIDVSNPFVSKDYEIGNNWLNSQYDYTSAIKSDTWSNDSLYVFDLAKDKINAIKKDTNGNANKYLADSCNLPENQQSDIVKALCKEMMDK